jgi:hypothetical protein
MGADEPEPARVGLQPEGQYPMSSPAQVAASAIGANLFGFIASPAYGLTYTTPIR